jgi:hypothetical protein
VREVGHGVPAAGPGVCRGPPATGCAALPQGSGGFKMIEEAKKHWEERGEALWSNQLELPEAYIPLRLAPPLSMPHFPCEIYCHK